jgi:phenylacetate-coenzyme A ligase PaaK-like adenylate-forming protein
LYSDFIYKVPFSYPVLTREIIRSNIEYIISDDFDINELEKDTTNGTTEGNPLVIYKSKKERIQLDFELWKHRKKSLSSNIGKKVAVFFYNYRNPNAEVMENVTSRRTFINIPMNREREDQYIKDLDVLKKHKVNFVIGPASLFYFLALMLDFQEKEYQFDYIEFTSEYVPDKYRKKIESTFKCTTSSQYSCHEVWGIGYSTNTKVMETLNNTVMEGERDKRFIRNVYKPIITNLYIKSMPFIRYLLSDYVILADNYEKDQEINHFETFGYRSIDEVRFGDVQIHCSEFDNFFIKELGFDFLPLNNYQLIYSEKNGTIFILQLIGDVINIDGICLKLSAYIKEKYGILVNINSITRNSFFRDNVSGKIRGIMNEVIINSEIW